MPKLGCNAGHSFVDTAWDQLSKDTHCFADGVSRHKILHLDAVVPLMLAKRQTSSEARIITPLKGFSKHRFSANISHVGGRWRFAGCLLALLLVHAWELSGPRNRTEACGFRVWGQQSAFPTFISK